MSDHRHALAERLAGLEACARQLRPCWQDPSRFYEQRDELVDGLRSLAWEMPQPARKEPIGQRHAIVRPELPVERERRCRALVAAKDRELGTLRRLLAATLRRTRPRRRCRDDRQLHLLLDEQA